MIRDIPLLKVFRYVDGPRIENAAPVIVTFKNRKDKEQLIWRCKEKLRKAGILVTEDSQVQKARAFSCKSRCYKRSVVKKAAELCWPRRPQPDRGSSASNTFQFIFQARLAREREVQTDKKKGRERAEKMAEKVRRGRVI